MDLKFLTGLLCDDVRQEASGKLIIIGAYTGEMHFPRFPAAGHFTMMVCAQSFKTAFSGEVEFRLRLGEEAVAEMSGEIGLPADGTMWAPLPLPPISFAGEAALIAEGKVKGSSEWQRIMSISVRRGPMQSAG